MFWAAVSVAGLEVATFVGWEPATTEEEAADEPEGAEEGRELESAGLRPASASKTEPEMASDRMNLSVFLIKIQLLL